MPALPTLVTIWLAEAVEIDDRTGGLNALGMFNRIVLPVGATNYDTPFTVFFSVTDVRARVKCELRLIDLSDLEVVYARPVFLDPVGPDEVGDLYVRVNTLPVPHPGSYVFLLVLDGEPLGSTRLVVEGESLPEAE